MKAEQAKHGTPDIVGVASRSSAQWQEQFPLKYQQEDGGPLKPQFCIEMLRDNTPDDCILVSGVGQHQMWASQLWKFKQPNTWVNSGGLGTMGYAVPAAVGAKVGRPDRMVWAIDGDGCFQMTAQELVTAAAERIPVKIAILNNAYLGMVRQWQELFYEERYSEVYLSPDLPDYVKWAEAMGCVGMRVDTPGRRRADDREGERDRRPSGRDRLPHRLAREGVPDGARRARRTTTSSSAPSSAKAVTDACDGMPASTTSSPCSSRTSPACCRASPGLFSRRGFNIFSLAVSPTDDERFSRMTIVVDAESAPLEQVVKQLNKLIPVIKITEVPPAGGVERELMMVTVKATAEARSQVTELTAIFEAKIVDVGYDALTIMVAGEPDKLDAFSDLVKPFGIVELQRTGRIALPRLSRQPTRLRAVKTARAVTCQPRLLL